MGVEVVEWLDEGWRLVVVVVVVAAVVAVVLKLRVFRIIQFSASDSRAPRHFSVLTLCRSGVHQNRVWWNHYHRPCPFQEGVDAEQD